VTDLEEKKEKPISANNRKRGNFLGEKQKGEENNPAACIEKPAAAQKTKRMRSPKGERTVIP